MRDTSKLITADDIVRKYNLEELKKDRRAIKTIDGMLTRQNTIIENYIKEITKYINNQAGNSVCAWFFDGTPTLENNPFVSFDDEEKENHIGDLYYDKDSGYAYQLTYENEAYQWLQIDDDNIINSLAIANSSVDASDNLRRTFFEQSTTPYEAGDIWYNNGIIYRCRATRTAGEWSNADWCLQNEYNDESVLLERTAVLDQKIETNYESIVRLETTTESIEASVQSNTTQIKNNDIAVNEKFNDYALNETVTEQIDSVNTKIASNEATIRVVSETLENGITKVRTEKGFTFDDNGLLIDDTGSKVKNQLDENGMEITDKSNLESLLFAGYDTVLQETVVNSKNLIVKKYLSIRHSRYEEYNNPNHGIGTGCFDV